MYPWNKGLKGYHLHTEETRKKISKGLIGRICSEETRQKLRIAHKGRSFSEETKTRMSEAAKGKFVSQETRGKMSAAKKECTPWNKGKSMPEKTRLAINKANKGNQYCKGFQHSEETKKKLSIIRMGHPGYTKGKIGIHSKEGLQKIAEAHKGSKNNNWNGGSTPIIYRIRNSLRYKEWRLKIFKRDDYTCQICGNRGGKLCAHHIFNFSKFANLRFFNWNGITLCGSCHGKRRLKIQALITYEV